ncbi:MAG: hypothetical protein KKD00_12560, partial [Gammaproteobacteria bacterium]|nr:hypothetical protein [Gammaproteobacteria bacterium]
LEQEINSVINKPRVLKGLKANIKEALGMGTEAGIGAGGAAKTGAGSVIGKLGVIAAVGAAGGRRGKVLAKLIVDDTRFGYGFRSEKR